MERKSKGTGKEVYVHKTGLNKAGLVTFKEITLN